MSTITTTDLYAANPSPYPAEMDSMLPMGRTCGHGKFNPTDPDSHDFGRSWLAGQTAYVLNRLDKPRKSGASRVITGWGEPYPDWLIGAKWRCRHDQTGGFLGEYEVVGIVVFDAEGTIVRSEGDVPNRRLSASVFK